MEKPPCAKIPGRLGSRKMTVTMVRLPWVGSSLILKLTHTAGTGCWSWWLVRDSVAPPWFLIHQESKTLTPFHRVRARLGSTGTRTLLRSHQLREDILDITAPSTWSYLLSSSSTSPICWLGDIRAVREGCGEA